MAVRACAFALLFAADVLFLWMFFSTDPLEQLAADVRPTADALATEAFRFAAAWRHGMAVTCDEIILFQKCASQHPRRAG